MKKLFCLILVVLLVAFLFLTKPTPAEFAEYYAQQNFSDETILDGLMQEFVLHMASQADYQDYGICRVFEYNGSQTLGIALTFWPLDDLTQQAEDLRAEYAQWLDQANIS